MLRVIVESPYAGSVARNVEYARRCMRDSLDRGEAPILSHLLYTQVLDDGITADRKKGIEAGLAWSEVAHLAAVYTDHGTSLGMEKAIKVHRANGTPIAYRKLGIEGRMK